ncbi:unnamed protein product [Paramecium octaurelia]|uniref:Uncharacterized protein n=1 Tax=Paramecium octaurelia TaxID=43137 RepID=A0A8S1WI25_PAROT|nr:unnamed protein product [Paramecium octaurelia]
MKEKQKLNLQPLIHGFLLFLSKQILLPSVQLEIELEKMQMKNQRTKSLKIVQDLTIYSFIVMNQNLKDFNNFLNKDKLLHFHLSNNKMKKYLRNQQSNLSNNNKTKIIKIVQSLYQNEISCLNS